MLQPNTLSRFATSPSGKIVVTVESAGLLAEAQALGRCSTWCRARITQRRWKQSVHSAIPITSDMTEGRLAGASVLDLDGRAVALRELYQHGPVVIVWLRHYG